MIYKILFSFFMFINCFGMHPIINDTSEIDPDQFVKDCIREEEEFKKNEEESKKKEDGIRNAESTDFRGQSNIEIMRENERIRNRISEIQVALEKRNRVIMYIVGAISIPVILYIRYKYNKKKDNDKVENGKKA